MDTFAVIMMVYCCLIVVLGIPACVMATIDASRAGKSLRELQSAERIAPAPAPAPQVVDPAPEPEQVVSQDPQERMETAKALLWEHYGINKMFATALRRVVQEAISKGLAIDVMRICRLTPREIIRQVEHALSSELFFSLSPEEKAELAGLYFKFHADEVKDLVASEYQMRRALLSETAKSEAALSFANPQTAKTAEEESWVKDFESVGRALTKLESREKPEALEAAPAADSASSESSGDDESFESAIDRLIDVVEGYERVKL